MADRQDLRDPAHGRAAEVYVGGGGKQWVESVGGLQVGDRVGELGDQILVGDSSTSGLPSDAGDAMITGRDGDDTLFGDNVDFFATATFGTVDGADSVAGQLRGPPQ